MSDKKPKREAPHSVRLSVDERARYLLGAAGMPLGAFFKMCADLYLDLPTVRDRNELTPQDRDSLARIYNWLGTSRIGSNLNQIAKAINERTITVTPETEAVVCEASRALITIRDILLTLLPKKRRR
ncbi:plasmid mobilization relaxosome protein MobC [Sphingobium sp. AN641]|uniref:plasmid mobilization relaxosome protein MobC n=1 Tax=Sphingobium sp. AN641 TaxID=3133443 RepID=UPI0030C06415